MYTFAHLEFYLMKDVSNQALKNTSEMLGLSLGMSFFFPFGNYHIILMHLVMWFLNTLYTYFHLTRVRKQIWIKLSITKIISLNLYK